LVFLWFEYQDAESFQRLTPEAGTQFLLVQISRCLKLLLIDALIDELRQQLTDRIDTFRASAMAR